MDEDVTIQIPARFIPLEFTETVDRLRGHLSLDEWVLTLIQREVHDPRARVYA